MKPQARMRRVVALAVIVVGLPHAGVAGDAPVGNAVVGRGYMRSPARPVAFSSLIFVSGGG